MNDACVRKVEMTCVDVRSLWNEEYLYWSTSYGNAKQLSVRIVFIAIRFIQNINSVRYNYYGSENSFEEVSNHWTGVFYVCPDEVAECNIRLLNKYTG